MAATNSFVGYLLNTSMTPWSSTESKISWIALMAATVSLCTMRAASWFGQNRLKNSQMRTGLLKRRKQGKACLNAPQRGCLGGETRLQKLPGTKQSKRDRQQKIALANLIGSRNAHGSNEPLQSQRRLSMRKDTNFDLPLPPLRPIFFSHGNKVSGRDFGRCFDLGHWTQKNHWEHHPKEKNLSSVLEQSTSVCDQSRGRIPCYRREIQEQVPSIVLTAVSLLSNFEGLWTSFLTQHVMKRKRSDSSQPF